MFPFEIAQFTLAREIKKLKMYFFLLFKQSPCSSDPCLNQATCVAKYENDDYHCACAVGYVGKHCEIGIETSLLIKHGYW